MPVNASSALYIVSLALAAAVFTANETDAQQPAGTRDRVGSAPKATLQPRIIPDSSIASVLLANRMARHGRRARSPLTLLAAAEILINHRVRDLAPAAAEDRSSRSRPGDSRPEEPARLLVEARQLAAGNRPMLTVVAALEQRQQSQKGALGSGPRQTYGRLAAGAARTFNIDFTAQTDAVVYVGSDGDSRLDLSVFDSRGSRVAFDAGPYGESVVRWKPARRMAFRVLVRNRGSSETWYVLLTN